MIQKSFDRLRQNYPAVSLAIIAVAMPTALALGYYYVTGDPNFRPLGITIERLAERGEAVGNDVIFGTITHDGTPEGEKEAEKLSERLVTVFIGKGIDASFRLLSNPDAKQLQIFYYIDDTRLGPFNPRNAARSVLIAVDALTLSWAEEYGIPPREW